MPYLETPDDLADQLADWIGVYGGHDSDESPTHTFAHCRVCFVSDMSDRIRLAVENEQSLERGVRRDESNER